MCSENGPGQFIFSLLCSTCTRNGHGSLFGLTKSLRLFGIRWWNRPILWLGIIRLILALRCAFATLSFGCGQWHRPWLLCLGIAGIMIGLILALFHTLATLSLGSRQCDRPSTLLFDRWWHVVPGKFVHCANRSLVGCWIDHELRSCRLPPNSLFQKEGLALIDQPA
jgi:hypothetical protein